MPAYYNEHDPGAAEWLRQLIAARLIAPGDVDERSIADVQDCDLKGYVQCHFFAGIGGWSHALRLAGWGDDRPVWTGSCPCQPFSLAGQQKGFADERHLWPVWFKLICERRPARIFGEQVASATEWLGLVRGNLGQVEYAVGCIPFEAASAGADHLRARYGFVAHDTRQRRREGRTEHGLRFGRGIATTGSGSAGNDVAHHHQGPQGRTLSAERSDQRIAGADGVANADRDGIRNEPGRRGWTSGAGQGIDRDDRENSDVADREEQRRPDRHGGPLQGPAERERPQVEPERCGGDGCDVGHASIADERGTGRQSDQGSESEGPDRGSGAELGWVIGADGKARRVKSGVRLLVDGFPGRVGLLRGFGNAIDPRAFALFIEAADQAVGDFVMNTAALARETSSGIFYYDRERSPGVYIVPDMRAGFRADQGLRQGIANMIRKARRYARAKEGDGTHWTHGYAGRVIEWALSCKPEPSKVRSPSEDLVQATTAVAEAPIDHPVSEVAASDDARVIEDSSNARSGSLNQTLPSDPIVRSLCEAKRARKEYPAGHTFGMTNPTVNGQWVTLGTCTCGDTFSYAYGSAGHEKMDAAIEAHWQKFDSTADKIDGRGQPIQPSPDGFGGQVGAKAPAPAPKKSRKRKPPDAPEGILASNVAEAGPHTALRTEPAPLTAPPDGAGSPIQEAAPIGAGSIEVSESPVYEGLTPGSEIDPVREAGLGGGSLAQTMAAEPADDWSPLLSAALDMAWREEPVVAAAPGPVSVDQLHPKITLYSGSCLDALPLMAENSVDSCVCDPPYHLTTGKKGGSGIASLNKKSPADRARISTGFMGKAWDGGDVAFQVETWREVFRVLKPGAHLIAFSGTRTYHRMVCAIEDAGFEIRDQIGWLYGSGFPKSLNVSKAIDKALGAERTTIRIPAAQVRNPKATGAGRDGMEGASRPYIESAMARGFHEAVSDEAVSDEAVQWDGWGTALKPSQEPVVVARKPLSEKTVVANVLKWGTGAINVDGCRVEWLGPKDAAAAAAAAGFADSRARGTASQSVSIGKESRDGTNQYDPDKITGRWPANIIHDGSDEVLSGFPDTDGSVQRTGKRTGVFGEFVGQDQVTMGHDDDGGSAARFFYTAKADDDDRIASKHPTVKPVDLMQYLTRLVTPPRGVVLDPFAGTGTTGEGAFREGFSAVLIEREAEYQDDIRRRVRLMLSGPEERSREIIKTKLKDQPPDPGPLFGGSDSPPPPSGDEIAEAEST